MKASFGVDDALSYLATLTSSRCKVLLARYILASIALLGAVLILTIPTTYGQSLKGI